MTRAKKTVSRNTTKRADRPSSTKRAEGRPARIPVGVNRDVLTVAGKDNDYVYRWVNDKGTRVQKFIAGGYELVEDDDLIIGTSADTQIGSGISTNVDSSEGTKAVLMRITKEFYEEDQRAKADAVNESEEVIKQSVKKIDSNDVEHYGEASLEKRNG